MVPVLGSSMRSLTTTALSPSYPSSLSRGVTSPSLSPFPFLSFSSSTSSPSFSSMASSSSPSPFPLQSFSSFTIPAFVVSHAVSGEGNLAANSCGRKGSSYLSSFSQSASRTLDTVLCRETSSRHGLRLACRSSPPGLLINDWLHCARGDVLFPVERLVLAKNSKNSGRRVKSCAGASVRAVAAQQAVDNVEKDFEQTLAGGTTKRQYYMLGGKGGVGKTSLAASLAVSFASSGHPTLVVSTDPAHSLSDSFAQDLGGGLVMRVDGPDDLPLFAMEINPEQTRQEFRDSNKKNGGDGVQDFMDSMGLGGWVEQLSELKLGELLDTPPPGLDEAIAISKVVQFIQAPEYAQFTRIVFDTAPTGHTLRLLSLPDFVEASIGKILKLKQKLASATNAIKNVFGQGGDGKDTAGEKLEQLKQRMILVRDIFRDKGTTEFIIVTIPTVMAVSESSRLRSSLDKEGILVKRLVVNQILPPSAASDHCKFCAIKRKDQQRAMDIVKHDSNLKDLELIESPLFDLEIRGVPALTFMGNLVWKKH